jgi:hypothetical protein
LPKGIKQNSVVKDAKVGKHLHSEKTKYIVSSEMQEECCLLNFMSLALSGIFIGCLPHISIHG